MVDSCEKCQNYNFHKKNYIELLTNEIKYKKRISELEETIKIAANNLVSFNGNISNAEAMEFAELYLKIAKGE